MQQLSPSRVAATLKAALTSWKTGSDSFDARAALGVATCGGRCEALTGAEIDYLITVIDQAALECVSDGSLDDPIQMTAYAGYLRFAGQRIDFGFSSPVGAGDTEVDSAALKAIEEHIELDFLPVGDFVANEEMP